MLLFLPLLSAYVRSVLHGQISFQFVKVPVNTCCSSLVSSVGLCSHYSFKGFWKNDHSFPSSQTQWLLFSLLTEALAFQILNHFVFLKIMFSLGFCKPFMCSKNISISFTFMLVYVNIRISNFLPSRKLDTSERNRDK